MFLTLHYVRTKRKYPQFSHFSTMRSMKCLQSLPREFPCYFRIYVSRSLVMINKENLLSRGTPRGVVVNHMMAIVAKMARQETRPQDGLMQLGCSCNDLFVTSIFFSLPSLVLLCKSRFYTSILVITKDLVSEIQFVITQKMSKIRYFETRVKMDLFFVYCQSQGLPMLVQGDTSIQASETERKVNQAAFRFNIQLQSRITLHELKQGSRKTFSRSQATLSVDTKCRAPFGRHLARILLW